ncbi:MAG: hypothetical protein Q9181_004492 [Wetmoreana brouardii]
MITITLEPTPTSFTLVILGVFVPLSQLFSAPILQQMANRIEDESEAPTISRIDWTAETTPDPQWADIKAVQSGDKVVSASRIVVLTGATGFLGRNLLKQLTDDPRVEKIHCLAVRSEENLKSLREVDKVIAHQGDLTLPWLGLSENTAQELFEEADIVIHNGADVSHLKTYPTLRLANVDSTKELVKLCLVRRTPFHFVSTAGVAFFTHQNVFNEVSVASTPPPTHGSDGYTASKWASERFLERAADAYGFPVWIHRPSSITRSSSFLGEGTTEWELLQNLFKYSRVMKATMASDLLQGSLDFVAVENVAKDIVGKAIDDDQEVAFSSRAAPATTAAPVTYVHQTGDFCLPISDMKAFLETEMQASEPFESLPIGEWVDRATALGLHGAVGAAFKKVEDTGTRMVFPSFVKDRKD